MKYSEEAAFAKLAAQCSTAEYCTNDIEKKMRRWEMDETSIKKIIQRLLDEHFIDNTRYCRAFIKDKILFNRWGRRKIEGAYRKTYPRRYLKNSTKKAIWTPFITCSLPVVEQ